MIIKGRINSPSLLLAVIAAFSAVAMPMSGAERSKLVLGIIIDGLDSQYLELLQDKFGSDGFNRLINSGVAISAADFGTNTDAAASAAMIMTGASPSTNGVSASLAFDRDALALSPTMTDSEVMGNFTDRPFSARQLAVSTLADEQRIAGGGISRVFSIAADPSQAVILAGHSANAALWLNDKTGNWASSTYYKELPTSITYRNRLRPLSLRLDTVQWTPLRPREYYDILPEHLTHYPFRYTFPAGNTDRYAMLASSPIINKEITDLACELIDDLRLGASEATDMVNVVYTLKPFDFTRNDDNRYELVDSYLRLDRDLARLFKKAEDKAGKGNALFFVAATPPTGLSRRDDERWLIPYGEFSTKKAKSLLNMYLIARFGNGDWVTAWFNNRFFLNHKLIGDLNLDPVTVRNEAATFLEKMSGVDKVYTIDEILNGRGDSRLEALQRNELPSAAGDLYVNVAPGWETTDDINTPKGDKRISYVNRYAPAIAPVFILAPGVAPRKIDTPVDVRVIAPTVARLLRIRSPNGASLPPLIL